MHPVLILVVKVLVDSIPGMTQDVSWTVVNLSYMAVGSDPVAKLMTVVVSHVSSCDWRAIRVNVSVTQKWANLQDNFGWCI